MTQGLVTHNDSEYVTYCSSDAYRSCYSIVCVTYCSHDSIVLATHCSVARQDAGYESVKSKEKGKVKVKVKGDSEGCRQRA
jgi:hypothetical protein